MVARYVNLYVEWVLEGSVQKQYEAFHKGFMRVCGGKVRRLPKHANTHTHKETHETERKRERGAREPRTKERAWQHTPNRTLGGPALRGPSAVKIIRMRNGFIVPVTGRGFCSLIHGP